MRVTAMDLGTSNTCVATCDKGIVTILQPENWYSAALGGAIPSLVLYKHGQAFLIGAAAELEFGEAGEEERRAYTLRSQFKPDIAVHEDAKNSMLDFLRMLHKSINPQGHILVGIPSQAENHYQQILRLCLTETGWHDARFLREPVGAVLHYIASGILPPSLAARGVLTVDFGGGTCDLAVLRRADVVGRHGDMLYGGRLFDDLFYQILLEHNAGLEEALQDEGNAYYVHWVACRRAKEEFSALMHRDRTAAASLRVRWSHFDGQQVREEAAYITKLTWTEFLARAGAYTASPSLLHILKEHGNRSGLSTRGQGLLQGKHVDLISWFEDILLASLESVRRENMSPLADIPLILLTGGSSAWPFVHDIVRQTLGTRTKILMGDEPYADIAKGLAKYHLLAEHLREGRAALQNELPLFMEERIRRKAIRQNLQHGAENLLQDISQFLRDVILIPSFTQYRQEGGTLKHLMQNIATSMLQEEERLHQLLDHGMNRIGRTLVNACRAELKAWFHEKGIPIMPERLEHTWLGVEMDTFVTHMAQELGKATLSHDRNMAEIATMVAGPSLAALAVSGAPLTALTLGIGGVVLMKVFRFDRMIVEKMLLLPLPSLIRRRIFQEARLEKLCTEQLKAFGDNFTQQILEQWSNAEGRILAEAARVAKEEIDALDVLNISTT